MENLSLKKFFVEEKEKKNKENVLVFDTHNLIFRAIHVANYSFMQSWSKVSSVSETEKRNMTENEMYSYWKYLMVNSIFAAIKSFEPDKLIMATDGSGGSWRKDLYPLYKANRKISRDKSTIDFSKFFPILDQFLQDLQKSFKNVYFIRLDRIEGDDVIGVLINDVLKNSNITVISSDRDLVQLLKHKHVRQFDPIKKTFIKSLNPKSDLLLKIIKGDSSDNIPAIKKRCGKAGALKILNDGIDIHLVNDEIKNNYERNTQLINLDLIPQHIKTSIVNQYTNYKIQNHDGMSVFNFLIRNKINKFVDELQTIYTPMLKKLS